VSRSRFLTGFLIGGAAALVLAGAAAFAFSQSGLYNVGAAMPHTDFTEWLTQGTMIRSVRLHAKGVHAPERFNDAKVVAGFCQYEVHCLSCHGAAGVANDSWVNGMEPSPPYLLDASRKWTRPQLYWIVSNGIKMTGMPAWKRTLTDEEMWSIVAYLEATDRMPPTTFARWRSSGVCDRLARASARPAGR
jgi:mono/diheme cytochrome c family protein